MGFIDKLKKRIQESVNNSQATAQQQQPVQMSTADRFKQFLNSKNAVSNIIRSNPVLSKRANERISYLQEQPKEQQTATQNIIGAERTVNLPTKAVGTTANNQTVRKTSATLDEDAIRTQFKKANPNATEEEINNAVANLSKNKKATTEQKVQVAQSVAQSNTNNTTKQEITKIAKDMIDKQVPQQAQEQPTDTGYEFKRNAHTGRFELKGKILKEPEAITELKKTFKLNTAEGWTPESIAEFITDTRFELGQIAGQTAENTLASITKGVAGMGEGIDDFKNYAYAQIVDWAGNLTKDEKHREDLKSYAEDIRRDTAETGKWIENLQDWQEESQEGSVLGGKGEQVGEGIGSSVPTMAIDLLTAGAGKLATVGRAIGIGTMGLSSAGNSLSETYQTRGKLDALAWAKAGVDGATTVATEEASGILGKGATWDSKLATSLNENIKNSVAKTLVRLNVSSLAEGTEEIEEYFANKVTNSLMNSILNLTGDEGQRFEGIKSIDMKEAVDNFTMGYISAFLTQGATKVGQTGINLPGNNFDLKRTIDQMSMQEETSAKKEIEEANLKTTEKQLEKAIKREKNPELINYLTEQLNAVKGQIESLNAPAEISEQFKQVLQGRDAEEVINENMSLSERVAQPVQRAVDLVRDTLESTIQANAQYFKSDADRQKFLNYGKGIQAITEQAGNPVKVLLDTTVGGDGLITINNADGTRAILVNPSMSNQSMEETLVHELFHNVKNTDEFKQIGETLDNFVKKFKIKDSSGNLITLDNAKKQLQERYENYYKQHGLDTSTLDIDEESHAFLLQKIIGDEKTLNNLTKQQPKIVQAIYDFVDKISMRLKGLDKDTANTIIDLRNKLGNALKNNGIEVASTIKNAVSQDTTTDNQGRTLSKQQQEYFKDSKVRDENGNLLEVYHGTKTDGINIFEYNPNKQTGTDYGKAFYFTSDYTKAQGYQYDIENDPAYKEYSKKDEEYKNWVFEKDISEEERSKRIKEWSNWHEKNSVFDILNNENFTPERLPKGETKKVYLNLTNPYIADAKGEYYFNVYDKYFKEAKENGNDGIIVKNVIDVARGEHKPIDVYIAFNENQIKNVDNTNPTSNQDIRYSISENAPTQDNQGRELSKGQQEFFKNSKVKDENGNLLTMYHGTNAEFNEFKYDNIGTTGLAYGRGFYFTDNKSASDYYGSNKKEVYLDIRKPMEIGKTQMSKDDFRKLVNAVNEATNGTLEVDYGSLEDAVGEYDYNGDDIDLTTSIRVASGLKDTEFYKILKDTLGFDGIKANNQGSEKNGNFWIAFQSNQIKNVDNTNPTDNPDIRYSQNTKNNNIWNNFLDQVDKETGEKNRTYFKQGETKAKLPVGAKYSVSTDDYNKQANDLIDKANIPDTDKRNFKNSLKGIEFTQDMMPELKDTIKTMEENAKADYDSILDTNRKYSDTDGIRKKTYQKYKRQTKAYDNSSLQNAMNIIQPNYQGRRTKEQWLQIASQIGTEIADKNNNEIEQIAFRSFIEAQPNQKGNLNRQGNKYVSFNSDDWVNTVYKAVEEQRNKPKKAPVKAETKKEIKAPVKEEVKKVEQKQEEKAPVKVEQKEEQTKQEEIAPIQEDKKERRTYKSIIESEFQTEEAKKIAKQQMGTDMYTPDSNKSQIDRADAYIEREGIDKAYERLMNNMDNDTFSYDKKRLLGKSKLVGVDDIALGERLMQYYSKVGDGARLQDVIRATALAGTEAGRTVQALGMIRRQTPDGQALWLQRNVDKLNDELARRKGGTINRNKDGSYTITNQYGKDITDKVDLFNLTPEMLEKVTKSQTQEELLDNVAEVEKELGQQVAKSTIEKLDEWRYFSMLANPKTHIRNMLGNLFMGKIQDIKNALAGGIEDVVAKFNPEMERTKTLKRASKEVKEFVKNDLNNADVQSMLEIGTSKYDKPANVILDQQRTFKSDIAEKTLGKLFNANSKALELEDAWGLRSAYKKAMAQYMTANKLTPGNMTDAQLQKARTYAVQQSKEATFHQASTLATTLEQLSKNGKVSKFFLDALVPFKKTPINVAKTGIQYSPVNVVKGVTTDLVALKQGKISANQWIDNISKGLTGSGIAVLGYALAQMGLLRGSGDDDKNKEYYDEQQGKQPYSLTIGDKTYSLDWLAPAGIPLFIGAETYGMTQRRKEKEGAIEEKTAFTQALDSMTELANSTAKALNPMAEMSMISGLTDTFSSISNAKGLEYFEQIGTNSASSYINQYFPTVLGQLARTIDPYERTTVSTKQGTIPKTFDQTKNQIMAKLPGVRQLLPVKTDVWGNDIPAKENILKKTVNNFINPATVKKVSQDSVDKGLNELFEQTGAKTILPTGISKKLTINGKDYILNGEDYQEYKKMYGQTSHELLQDMMNTEEYKGLNDEEKAKAVAKVYSYANEMVRLDYAKKKNQEMEKSSSYTTIEDLKKAGATQKDITSYIAKFDNIKADYDSEGNAISGSQQNKQIEWVMNSDMSDDAKKIVYENRIGADKNYEEYKGNINTYLRYKNDEYKAKNSKEGDKKNINQADKVNVLLNGNYSESEMTALYKAVGEDKQFADYKGNTKSYLKYKSEVNKIKGDKSTASDNDKMKALTSGGFTNTEIKDIYDTIANDNDYIYKALKKTNINMKEYLRYKQADLKADRYDDGTVSGKAINGTAKAKKVAFINNMNITYEQKLILMGSQNKLSNAERERVAYYINSLNMSQADKMKLYGKMKGFTVYKDGRVTW